MAINNRMTQYIAPDGYVYDPRVIECIDGVEHHMYAKYLFISKFDSIDNYILVPDPRGENNASNS